jgi:filamentous hemagglutinin family protein
VRKILLATSALVPLGLSFGLASALANPLGGQVVGGSASIAGQGTSAVTVTQSSQNAVVNWQSFNIGAGEITRFVQPNSSATILNRVTGDPNPSTILGTLQGNGRVFVINPNGVLIGNGAVVNTAGFLATTHDISNADFMAGRYNFNIPGNPSASVVNLGTITATNGGFAALVAPGVRNSGTITATFGKIGLASANGFSLDLYGDRLITIGVSDSIASAVRDVATGQTLKSLVQNDGKLKANGGTVQLSAVTARAMVDSVINTSGVIEARSIGRRNGKIVLGGPAASTKVAGAPTQTVKVSGKLNVASKKGKGGTIEVTGENIVLASARLDASGATGGGKVLIGGDTGGGTLNAAVASISKAQLEAMPLVTATSVSIDAASSIDASAKGSGDGGKVIVWSDGATAFNGSILARGGAVAGNGGFVEVSGKESLTFGGQADLGAANGARGTLLLDPLNATISTTAGTGVILASAIEAALAFADVVVTTAGTIGTEAGNIIVASGINWASSNSLKLLAYRDVIVNADITNTGGSANVFLHADATGTGVGTVTFGVGNKVFTAGNVEINFNPSVNPAGSGVNASSYVGPVENFAGNVGGGATLATHMLINTAYDLQNMHNNLSGAYALNRDIDATGVTSFGNFAGVFNGQNHTISNINNSGTLPVAQNTGTIRDVKFTNVYVEALTSNAVLGVIGLNQGVISNVHVLDGTITHNGQALAIAGGLVGVNDGGSIVNSSSAADVTVSDGFAGGLAGINMSTASTSISGSWATGEVTGGTSSSIGGLVGSNNKDISTSWASGTVTALGTAGAVASNVGGLVGHNAAPGAITQSFATGNVTGALTNSTTYGIGGLVGNNGGTITKAYARGNVNGGSTAFAGGLVGSSTAVAANSIKETYATGTVSGAVASFGGLMGYNADTSGLAVVSSYWNTTTSGIPTTGVGTGNSTNVFPITTVSLSSSLPAGFGAAWTQTPGHNSGFPHFPYETAVTTGNSNVVFKPKGSTNSSDDPVPPRVYRSQQIASYTPPPRDNPGPPLIVIALGNQIGSAIVGAGGGATIVRPVPGQPQFTPPPLPVARLCVGPRLSLFSMYWAGSPLLIPAPAPCISRN